MGFYVLFLGFHTLAFLRGGLMNHDSFFGWASTAIISGWMVLIDHTEHFLTTNGQLIALVCTIVSSSCTFLNYRINAKRMEGEK